MPYSGWGIRLFEANEYGDDATVDFFSNYKKSKARMLDTVIAFSGMYGIDNYLIWNIHKDLPHYDFSTLSLDLNIFMYKSTDIVCFQDFYRVQDIRYNTVKNQYTVYALSETTIRLRAKLVGYDVKSLSYLENRTAKQVIEEVIAKNHIFYVVFHEDNDATKTMLHYEYRYFDIDPEWTVLDFIEYIADENQYEWCVDTFVDKTTNEPYYILHIGHELKADLDMNASKPLGIEIDNQSESLYSMKITTNSSPMQPLANWENTHKCVWSKHTAGKGGGISKGCFVPTGLGHFNKHLFVRTLEGDIERSIGSSILNRRKVRIPSIGIGNILKDEGVLEGKTAPFIDEVSIQKNPDTYAIREPHNIIINRGDDLAVQHQLEKATRSTPYLDHQAGMLYPSPNLENPPPNSLIFNIDGKRESSVVGGYVYGGGREEFEIPIKNRDDFRLKFPDKSEIYYDAQMKLWHINALGGITLKDNVIEANDLPTAGLIKDDIDNEKIRMILHNGGFQVEGKIPLFILEPGGCFRIAPTYNELGKDNGRYELRGFNDLGRIDMYAESKINIKISEANGEIDIQIGPDGSYAGTINIDCAGTVNVGAQATMVNLAGGSKAFPLKDHTHPINCKPGPPTSTQKSIDDNSTKTKAT